MAQNKEQKEKYIPRLKKYYEEVVRKRLMEKMGYTNIYEVPKLEKIVVHMCVGKATEDPKLLDEAVNYLTIITGQKPLIIKAKKSVSAFGLRKGKPIACKVTLRRDRMYDFFDKLITFALPRIRDFDGMDPNSFDGRGNYCFGVEEQTIFPEIKPDDVKNIMGMDIIICTTAKTDDEARELLREMGFPFRRE